MKKESQMQCMEACPDDRELKNAIIFKDFSVNLVKLGVVSCVVA